MSSTLTLRNTTLRDASSSDSGAAVSCFNSRCTLTGLNVDNAHSDNAGGAVRVQANIFFSLTDSTFTGCSALAGGALSVTVTHSVEVSNVVFANNR